MRKWYKTTKTRVVTLSEQKILTALVEYLCIYCQIVWICINRQVILHLVWKSTVDIRYYHCNQCYAHICYGGRTVAPESKFWDSYIGRRIPTAVVANVSGALYSSALKLYGESTASEILWSAVCRRAASVGHRTAAIGIYRYRFLWRPYGRRGATVSVAYSVTIGNDKTLCMYSGKRRLHSVRIRHNDVCLRNALRLFPEGTRKFSIIVEVH